MTAAESILAERDRLGPIEVLVARASSMSGAHRALGELMKGPALGAIEARIAGTDPAALKAQIRGVRACRSFIEQCSVRAGTAEPVRRAILDYLECLTGWSEALGLGGRLAGGLEVDGQQTSALDLALWAQDDNTGCQTGMLRRADGSVFLWHTEEDTIGYFDKPRIVSFVVGDETLHAFMYPYLLPGPAFGWQAGQVHAVDTLFMRRDLTPVGAYTSVASWLIWRLGPAADAREVIRALSPFVDGCAVNVVQPAARGARATTHEFGGRRLASRSLRADAGAFAFQANAVCRPESPLGREEELSARDRAPYERRLDRAQEAMERLRARPREPAAQDLVRFLASRRGGSYANANRDVKAHCVACVCSSGLEMYVQSGSAHPEDVYRPQWVTS